MEVMKRGRDHKEILGMNMRSSTSTLDHCNSPNRDSSSKQLSSSSSPIREIRPRDHGNPAPNQTLDHHHTLSYQPNKPRRDGNIINYNPNPNPNPDPITPITAVSSSVRYRECRRNHAASSGGLVLDGCGEFMPSGDDGTVEALKCAACECHRNFHLKEIDGEPQYNPNYGLSRNNNNCNNNNSIVLPHHQHYLPAPPVPLQPNQNPHLHHHNHHDRHNSDRHPQYPVHPQRRPISAPVMMAFGGAESSSEDLNMFDHDHNVNQSKAAGVGAIQQASGSKKRFRTKFNHEQKEKMMEFAEKLGWRIQKHDDQEVQRFCSEVAVKRQVFKVWMHNNKQAMKKKQV